jgi:hypothetical protein
LVAAVVVAMALMDFVAVVVAVAVRLPTQRLLLHLANH